MENFKKYTKYIINKIKENGSMCCLFAKFQKKCDSRSCNPYHSHNYCVKCESFTCIICNSTRSILYNTCNDEYEDENYWECEYCEHKVCYICMNNDNVYEDWAKLFEEFPTRFLIGTDAKFGREGWPIDKYVKRIASMRKILGSLPTDVAQRIAYQNAQELLKN